MNTTRLLIGTLFGVGLLFAAEPVNAYNRCQYDNLTASEGKGRNAWAEAWGYLSPGQAATLDNYKESGVALPIYIEFANGCYRTMAGVPCAPGVPVTQNGPFLPGLVTYAFCYPSCYPPTQRLRFNGTYVGIDDASRRESRTVTAMTKGSTPENLSFSEQPIEAFGSWPTAEPIYVLNGEDGQRLEVTSWHPMVRSDGAVVKAMDLREGDMLLSDKARPVRLIRIEKFDYEGNVSNVRPASQNKVENILVAEGFLTGSQRFQMQWSDQAFRLFVRGRIDTAGIMRAEVR